MKQNMALACAYRDLPVLVLGGSGFIGAWTVRALHAQGAHVTAVVRQRGRAEAALGALAAKVRIQPADLSSPGETRRVLEAVKPAVVFNLAGYGVDRAERNQKMMARLNADLVSEACGSLLTMPPCGWSGLRLVHAGSALEYGRLEGPLHEGREARPTADYGRTKLEGTRRVAASVADGLRGVVARLFTVYGPGEHSDRLLPSLFRAATTGKRLKLTGGTQRRNFTYVEDVAEGLLRLATSAPAAGGEIVNLATDRLTSVREYAETAARVLGFDKALLDFGALPDLEDEMWHGDVDVTRLRDLTSWLPSTSIADGIRRSWEFTHAR